MDKSDVQQKVLSDLNNLFSFREMNGHCVVSTPFRYPYGGFVAVCCKADGDSILITDEAETFGWLSSQGGPMVPTPQQLQVIENTVVLFGLSMTTASFGHTAVRVIS